MNRVIAVLGLGAMGLPMAARLAERWEVRGFDVAAARRDLAVADGVVPAATVGEAVAGASHVVVAVRDGAQLESVLFGADGASSRLAPGSVVIVTSTVGAAAVTEVSAR